MSLIETILHEPPGDPDWIVGFDRTWGTGQAMVCQRCAALVLYSADHAQRHRAWHDALERSPG